MSAPLPTGTDATTGAGRWPASTASVTSRAMVAAPVEMRGSSPSTSELDRVLRGVRLRRVAGHVEVLPRLDDPGAEGPHPLDLAAVGVARREHDGRDPEGPRGIGDALPEVAGRDAGDRPVGPILPSPARAWIAIHVPRPLNERIGLVVSTLTMTGTPRRRDSPSWRYWGEWMNARSIRSWAARMAAEFEVGDRDQRGRGSRVPAARKGNARRNHRSVVGAADLHPRHRFRSGAPSSKSYDSRRVAGLATDLSTTLRGERCPFRGVVHRLSTTLRGQSISSGQPTPPGSIGTPSSSRTADRSSPVSRPCRCQLPGAVRPIRQAASVGSSASSIRRTGTRLALPDRDHAGQPVQRDGRRRDRADDEQFVLQAPVEPEVSDPAGRHDVAVERRVIGFRVERQQSGPRRQLQAARAGRPGRSRAAARATAAVLADRPRASDDRAGPRRPTRRRWRHRAGRPGHRSRSGSAHPSATDRGRGLVDRGGGPSCRDRGQLAGERRRDPSTDPHVAFAVLELDRAALADAGEQLAGRVRHARRRRRPTARRAAPRSRPAGCPSRSRSAPTRRRAPAIAGCRDRRRRVPPGRAGRPC